MAKLGGVKGNCYKNNVFYKFLENMMNSIKFFVSVRETMVDCSLKNFLSNINICVFKF